LSSLSFLSFSSLFSFLVPFFFLADTFLHSLDRLGKQRLELVAMVERQRDKWPWTDKRHKFSRSKTRYDDLKAALLEPKHGFSITSPSAIVGSVDSHAADADEAHEGAWPASCVRSPAPRPLPTAAGDRASDSDPASGCPLSIGAKRAPVVRPCTHNSCLSRLADALLPPRNANARPFECSSKTGAQI
jgi:hypothetical protein